MLTYHQVNATLSVATALSQMKVNGHMMIMSARNGLMIVRYVNNMLPAVQEEIIHGQIINLYGVTK